MKEATKQVDKSHYDLGSYMDKGRWISVWYQLEEVMRCQPQNVLEIGPGPGVLKKLAQMFGLRIETLDLDPALEPDHLGSATSLPFEPKSYDVVCAFQMLEHLPYTMALTAFAEMTRVARKAVVVSLPDVQRVWRYSAHIPRIGHREFLLPRPASSPEVHEFDGEHYWEINKKEHPLDKVIADFAARCRMVETYRMFEDPYYRFFVFRP